MVTSRIRILAFVLTATSIWVCQAHGDGGAFTLWHLGQSDNSTADLALGPGGYADYASPGIHLPGLTDAAAHWPYAHPGPEDDWAAGCSRAFTVRFGLERSPEGDCTLTLDLVDTHSTKPPALEVRVNGWQHRIQTEPGAGDDSVYGDPAKGQERVYAIPVPAAAFRAGDNTLTIETVSGCWLLYDAVTFDAPEGTRLTEVSQETVLGAITDRPVLVERAGVLCQPVEMVVHHFGVETQGTVSVGGCEPVPVTLKPGHQETVMHVPAHETGKELRFELAVPGAEPITATHTVRPARRWEVYLLHHTHLDIGYTHHQDDVMALQWQHLEKAMELAQATADYPPEARFKWLPEGLWAVDAYMKEAPEDKRAALIQAVRNGSVGLDALYGNELTALCRPEELCELTGCARRLSREIGVPIDSAMISDVPGYTWGLIPVLAHSGVKYMSIGPNASHRIGYTLEQWGDRPFYWVSPSGKQKVLCWVAGKAYSWFHTGLNRNPDKRLEGKLILDYLCELEQSHFPYDMVHVRYNIGSDNGPPDETLSLAVRDWNAEHVYPRFIIATPSEMFRAFEARYGDRIPAVSGDFTPYWEDGAASSARETAINRETAETLVQAQTIGAVLALDTYPADAFHDAWREVLLYDEHTWGAYNSISEPQSEFALQQWRTKQAFALDGARKARGLLTDAFARHAIADGPITAVDVFNTLSWTRTDLVTLPAGAELPGDRVLDTAGRQVLSQRLSDGRLAFLAKNVPAFGAKRYLIREGAPGDAGDARVTGNGLSNGRVQLQIDPATGAISYLFWWGAPGNLVKEGAGLNAYWYVAGREPGSPQPNGPVTIKVKEDGPLAATLEVVSDAPGCRRLVRQLRVVSGLDRIDITNTLDKEAVYGQEAVHFEFAFDVPEGVVRMDTPWAVVRPEADQFPGACKNYFTVQRWTDVSNQDFGVTWATVDAPLIELGRITCDPRAVGWLRRLEPTTTLYSYVMNNYWETNYKASQEGATVFRYALRPHGMFDSAAAARFGTGRSQPLLAVPVAPETPLPEPLLSIEPAGVIASVLKPADDGEGHVLRLFGASGRPEQVRIHWNGSGATQMWAADLAETRLKPIENGFELAAFEMKTIRIE